MPADSGRFGARSDSTWSNQTLSVVPVRRLVFDGDFGEQDKQRDFHEGVFLIEMLASLAVGRERRRRGSTGSCHSGARRRREPQMCNCTSGNLEIPGLVLRTIPE
jgi:hypothetical protein